MRRIIAALTILVRIVNELCCGGAAKPFMPADFVKAILDQAAQIRRGGQALRSSKVGMLQKGDAPGRGISPWPRTTARRPS